MQRKHLFFSPVFGGGTDTNSRAAVVSLGISIEKRVSHSRAAPLSFFIRPATSRLRRVPSKTLCIIAIQCHLKNLSIKYRYNRITILEIACSLYRSVSHEQKQNVATRVV